jgi:hypothetical protein
LPNETEEEKEQGRREKKQSGQSEKAKNTKIGNAVSKTIVREAAAKTTNLNEEEEGNQKLQSIKNFQRQVF